MLWSPSVFCGGVCCGVSCASSVGEFSSGFGVWGCALGVVAAGVPVGVFSISWNCTERSVTYCASWSTFSSSVFLPGAV
eukprot:4952731-Prorocentrum_lima.AAC.1